MAGFEEIGRKINMSEAICIMCGKHGNEITHDDFIRNEEKEIKKKQVELLKQEIKAITFDHTDKHKECNLTFERVAVDRVLRKINEAFEDVISKRARE